MKSLSLKYFRELDALKRKFVTAGCSLNPGVLAVWLDRACVLGVAFPKFRDSEVLKAWIVSETGLLKTAPDLLTAQRLMKGHIKRVFLDHLKVIEREALHDGDLRRVYLRYVKDAPRDAKEGV